MAWEDLIGLGIVFLVGVLIYSKVKKQSLMESLEEIKELLTPDK